MWHMLIPYLFHYCVIVSVHYPSNKINVHNYLYFFYLFSDSSDKFRYSAVKRHVKKRDILDYPGNWYLIGTRYLITQVNVKYLELL